MTMTMPMASNGNPIDRIPQKKLSKRALGKLSAFFSPADVVDLMDKSNWSLEKGIQVLAAIAQDENAASAARITSVRVLNQIMVEVGDTEEFFTGAVADVL